MKQEIEKIYIDFFEYYDAVKEQLEYIYEKTELVDILFSNIIQNLYYYYENKNILSISKDILSYFENESFLIAIISKIKYTIEYVNLIFYNVCGCDDILFNQYIGVMYYVSILEDLIMFLENKETDTSELEQELKELNELIYNKIELVNEFNQYLNDKIDNISKEYKSFFPSVLVFKLTKSILDENEQIDDETILQEVITDFLNNMGSFEELSYEIKKNDIVLYNQILKLENVILRLQLAYKDKEQIFEENNNNIVNSLIIELTNLYNVWLTELHRIYDLYGIEYIKKYHELIYNASIVKNILNVFGDIKENDEELADYFLACYENILENNLDDIDQFTNYGEDLIDQLCEYHDLVVNKLKEQIEFLYTIFKNK